MPRHFEPQAPTTTMKLTVVSAQGLAAADITGTSDPFCVVLLDHVEVGRTKVSLSLSGNQPVIPPPQSPLL